MNKKGDALPTYAPTFVDRLWDAYASHCECIAVPLSESGPSYRLSELYRFALERGKEHAVVVWISETGREGDWMHAILHQLERRRVFGSVIKAWSTNETLSQGKVDPRHLWHEVIYEIKRTVPRLRLIAFLPEFGEFDPKQVTEFIQNWVRHLPASLISASDQSIDWDTILPSNSYQFRVNDYFIKAATKHLNSRYSDELVEVLKALQEHGVCRLDSVAFCNAVYRTDAGAWTRHDARPAKGLSTFLSRCLRKRSDAAERPADALRITQILFVCSLDASLTETILEAANSHAYLYHWQIIQNDRSSTPISSNEQAERIIMLCSRGSPDTRPIIPRFVHRDDALTFLSLYREDLMNEMEIKVQHHTPAGSNYDARIVDLFAPYAETPDDGQILADIKKKLDDLSTRIANRVAVRNGYALLGDLAESVDSQLARECWSFIHRSPAEGEDINIIASAIMLGFVQPSSLHGATSFDDYLKRFDILDDDLEKLRLRYFAKNKMYSKLREGTVTGPYSGIFPNDIARCLYKFSLIDYRIRQGTDTRYLDETEDPNDMAWRMQSAFRLIAIESIIRNSRGFGGAEKKNVFISYRNSTKAEGGGQEAAKQIADALTEKGFSVFIDTQIKSGNRWSEPIVRAAVGHYCVVALISPAYCESPWCRLEQEIALLRRHHRDSMIAYLPIVLDDTSITDLRLGMQDRHEAVTDNNGLVRDLDSIVERIACLASP